MDERRRRAKVARAMRTARRRQREVGCGPSSTGISYGWPSGSRSPLYWGPCRCGELRMCVLCGNEHVAVLRCHPCAAADEKKTKKEAARVGRSAEQLVVRRFLDAMGIERKE